MDEKELEKMYKFAFEPHHSKKYRKGDPEANKRHLQEPERPKLSLHLSKSVLDPWLALETEAITKNNKNELRHELISEEDINRMEQHRQGGDQQIGPLDFD